MAIAVDPNRIHEYVLESDREKPDDQKTRFRLKHLTCSQLAEINDTYLRKKGEELSGGAMRRCLELCLVGWTGFRDQDSKEIAYPGSQNEALDRLQLDHLTEMGTHLLKGAKLDEGDLEK